MIDVAIIGAGPAGLSAGLYASRMGLKTNIYEKLNPGGQIVLSSEIENYPGVCGENMSGIDLMSCWPEQVKKFGAIIENKEVESISKNEDGSFTIFFADSSIKAISVIVATGSHPRKAGFENENEFIGKGISTCAVCDGFFYRNKEVAVIGGGNTALEEALYLSKIVSKVYLIHRRDTFRAAPNTIKRVESTNNIELILNSNVKKVYGTQFVEGIIVNQENQEVDLKVDGVFVFVGNDRNNGILKDKNQEFICNVNSQGEVLVDIQMKTSIDGLYAVGDIRVSSPKQVISSAGDGAVAALEVVKYVDKFKVNN